MQFCLEGWILPSPICDLHGHADYEGRLLGAVIRSLSSVKAEENNLSPALRVTDSVLIQQYYSQTSCNQFHENQSMNNESMDTNSLCPYIQQDCHRFY
jgi:hypothetical protein